ncbi:hypothetical protein TNCV_189971 [Trichonephila clavipes]|nr:hypothetical protein TNCV_189971 [Trichonephila clavipes]
MVHYGLVGGQWDDPTGLAYPKSGLEFVRKPLRRVGLPNSGEEATVKIAERTYKSFLQAEGKKVPLSIIQTLVESLPRKVKAENASGDALLTIEYE